MTAPDWSQASCLGADPDSWFPDKGQGHNSETLTAIRVCQRCPLQLPCARLGIDERHGIWGGLTREHRREAA